MPLSALLRADLGSYHNATPQEAGVIRSLGINSTFTTSVINSIGATKSMITVKPHGMKPVMNWPHAVEDLGGEGTGTGRGARQTQSSAGN